jgi:hypothetical protein
LKIEYQKYIKTHIKNTSFYLEEVIAQGILPHTHQFHTNKGGVQHVVLLIQFSDIQMEFVVDHRQTPSTGAYPEAVCSNQGWINSCTHKKTLNLVRA